MLTQLADNLWIVNYDLYNLGIHFPGRMIVVRLANQSLWLCSPIPIDDELAGALDKLGIVRYIVAPNRFHHLFLAPALRRYPQATLYGAPGLDKKRSDLSFSEILEDTAPSAWRDQIEQRYIRAAPLVSEVVFFHRNSGTLITTDIFMNVHRADGILSYLIYWIDGCWKRVQVPRLFYLLTTNRSVMYDDLHHISQWPIQRLTMAHGEIIENEAKDTVVKAFRGFGMPPGADATTTLGKTT